MAGLPKAGVELVAEGSSGFLSAMKAGEQAVNGFVGATDKAGGGISAFGEIATGALRRVGTLAVDAIGQATKAIAGFVSGSVTAAGDFQANMNVFGSVVGSAMDESGKSLEDFSRLFMKLGAELPVSTAEVQDAAIELAKGGIDPATIAAGGLRTALDLAAAGGVGLADSATIMAKQLGVWVASTADAGTKAAFLAQTADLLSQSANATTSDVSDLAVGLANAGGTAKIAGLDFRETVTGLSLLAPGFSSASDAGTSFKTFLSRLIPTTKPAISAMIDLGLATDEGKSKFYDAQGSFIGLAAAAELLQQKTEGLSEAQKLQAFQTIFGQDAIRAAAILAEQGAEGYDRMTASLAAAGTVQDQAKARQQGFNTALDNAKGSLESLQITIGSALLPILSTLLNTYIAPGINTLTTFANAVLGSNDAFAELSPTLQTVATTFQYLGQIAGEAFASFQTDGLGAGISTFAAGLETLSPALSTAVGLLAPLGDLLQNNLTPALAGVGIAITAGAVVAFGALVASALPVIATIAAVAAVGAVLVAAWQADFGGIQEIVSSALAGITALWTTYGPTIIATATALWDGAVATASAALDGLIGIVSGVLSGIESFWATNGATIVATANATWGSIVATVSGYISGLMGIVSAVLGQIVTFWDTNGAQIQATASTVWGQIGSIITSAMQIIGAVVQGAMFLIQNSVIPVFQGIAAFIASHGTEIQAIMQAVWTAISTIVTTVLATIQGVLSATMQAINGDWSGAWETIKNTCATIVQGLLTIIKATLDSLPSVFMLAFDGVFAALAGLVGRFSTVGGDMVRGIINGLKQQAGALASAAAQMASDAITAAKNAIFSNSPSKLAAREVGAPISQGVAAGIDASSKDAEAAARTMAVNAATSAGAGIAGVAEDQWKEAIRKRDAFANSLNTGGSSFDLSEIDPGNLDRALGQMNQIAGIVGAWAKKQTINPGVAKKFAETTQIVSSAVQATVTLRKLLMDMGPTADLGKVSDLVKELGTILGVFQGQIGTRKLNVGLLKSYSEGTAAAIATINTMIATRKALQDPGPPIDMNVILQLAAESRVTVRVIQGELVKFYQEERDALALAADVLKSSSDIITSIIGIRKAVADPGPPIVFEVLNQIAAEANAVVLLLQGSINPQTIKAREELRALAENVKQVVDTFLAMINLRKAIAEPQFPIRPEALESLKVDIAAVVQAIDDLVPEGFAVVAGLEDYAGVAEKAASILKGMIDLRQSMIALAPPISMQAVEQMVNELYQIVILFQGRAIPYAQEMVQTVANFAAITGQAIDRMKGMADLRGVMEKLAPPLDMKAVNQLINELYQIVIAFQGRAIPYMQATVDAVTAYGTVASEAISRLTDAAKLGEALKSISPISMSDVRSLAADLQSVVSIFVDSILPYAQALVDNAARYTAVAGNAISTISSVAKLGEDLKETSPIPRWLVEAIADEAAMIADIFAKTIIVYAEEIETNASRYAAIVGNAIQAITNVAKLGADLKAASPIPMQVINQAVADAKRIAQAFLSQLLPASEEEADAASRTAGVVGSAVGTIKDVLSLTSGIFKDYTSPSDEMIQLAISDAERFYLAMQTLAEKYEQTGSEAAGNMADALSKTASALGGIKTMILDIAPGANFTMNTEQLDAFESSAGQLIATAGRLGSLSLGTAMAGLDGIPTITGAMDSVFDSLGRGGALDWSKVAIAANAMRGLGSSTSAGGGAMQGMQASVSPVASSQTIYNSYVYNQSYGAIGTFNASNGVSRSDVQAMISQAYSQAGATAYSRRTMR